MLSALLCTALLAAPADAPNVKKLVVRPAADIAVTATFGVGLIVTEAFLKKFIAPPACRWCETNSYDLAISNARAPLALQGVADIGSTITVIGTPVITLGINLLLAWQQGATVGDVAWDILLVMQAALSAMALQQTAKFFFARERPLAYRLAPEDKGSTAHPEDNNVSFFSGHTALAFAAATAAGTVARLRGYKYYWLAWVIGLPLAALTGYQRIAADKHWFSDVLIGAAVGAASGYFIPTLFHGREEDEGPPRFVLAPMPLGLAVAVRLD